MNKLTNQKQFWFLLSGGKNASFLICWGATQRLPGCNSGSEPALLPFTWTANSFTTVEEKRVWDRRVLSHLQNEIPSLFQVFYDQFVENQGPTCISFGVKSCLLNFRRPVMEGKIMVHKNIYFTMKLP